MSKTYELSYTAEHIDKLLGVVDEGGFVKGVQINSGEVETPDEHGKISLEVTKQDVGLGQVTNDAQVKRTEMGSVNGVATLDSNGILDSEQMPRRFQAEAVNFSDGGNSHMVTVRKEGDYDDGEEGIGIIGIEDQTISGSAIIRGVATPIGGTDAANKSYVDNAVSPSSNLVHKTGNETIFGEKIFAGSFYLQNPTISKTILASVEGADNGKISKISFWDSDDDGDVRLSKIAEPSNNNDAATKGYVDSSIPDVSDFVTNTVNNLTNYYLKSETYTKSEVEALIGAIQQFHYEIYQTLPSSGESNVLYLIGPTGSGSDRYEEYVYANNAFTKIGDTSIDLSGYVTTSALNTALFDYTTTANLTTLLSGKQDTLTFDNSPTSNSNNPVKSGGVYTALQDKADKSEMSVTQGTGTDADKTTIQLKNDTTATVLTQHQDISGKADKIYVDTVPQGGMSPNKLYRYGVLSQDTTFALAAATDNTIANVWMWTFQTGIIPPTISWPQGVKFAGNITPIIDGDVYYEVSVMDNVLTCIKTESQGGGE